MFEQSDGQTRQYRKTIKPPPITRERKQILAFALICTGDEGVRMRTWTFVYLGID